MSAFNVMEMWDSQIFNTVEKLENTLAEIRKFETVGFVPTMGALHHGHLSLVQRALNECDRVVVSIFVNPTQFDNADDLEKYPGDLQTDVELLNTVGDILVFAPDVEEIYPENYQDIDIELGSLGEVMEGKFRPGHFKGVMNVVKRLFDIVVPARAYFGKKDFQQVAVIRHMVRTLNLPVEIVPCEIVREESGLASSSRNVRLSETEKRDALVLSHSLKRCRDLSKDHTPSELKKMVEERIEGSSLKLEYFEIVHPDTLEPILEWVPGANACIAAYCGETRLIDNMQIVSEQKNL